MDYPKVGRKYHRKGDMGSVFQYKTHAALRSVA